MVHESYYWKQPLLESAKKFKKYQELSEINEELYIQIEKDIFIGFYSIRKLLDTVAKITDELKEERRNLSWFSHIGDTVTWRNNHKLYLFNLLPSI